MTDPASNRSGSRRWWICGLLLLASAINYMDRQTLANASVRISTEFQLKQEEYGNLELAFGWAFAAGSLFFGVLVDRISVRWVYPVVLFLWSATGFATGLVESYSGLLVCRTALGLFEAGHWPCAVKATQRLLEPKDRSMGNSVLQSGTSIGAIITPLMMRALMTEVPGSWRIAFQIIGATGLLWLILWFSFVRAGDLEAVPVNVPTSQSCVPKQSIWTVIFSRRMLVVIVVIALINTGWQIIRAWLPKFLMEGRGYSESAALYFNSLFYVATDVGCIGAGILTLWWHQRGMTVHGARLFAFGSCAALSALTLIAVALPKGWMMLGVLLLVGAGALGVFPIYHALTQDLSREHQGTVTGVGGVAAWILSPAQKYFGRLVDSTGSFDLGFAVVGCLPLMAFLVLWWLWEKPDSLDRSEPGTS
ncbi:MAG: MFS transporter [Pedosphaera sp.]|nr:MFS transporter [Pedosphaera sp.]